MTYLTRGPVGTTGIGSKGQASNEPTPASCASQYRSGGEGMAYLATGPGKAGDRQQANASKEPNPFRAPIASRREATA